MPNRQVKDRIAEVARSTRTILEERAGLLRVGMVAYRDLWGGEEPMLEVRFCSSSTVPTSRGTNIKGLRPQPPVYYVH